jgi:hypothetical protein
MAAEWELDALIEHLAAVIERREGELRLEQAVYGLDALEERQIQALLADGLAETHDVAREVHYPASRGSKRTHRPRCDLVLTPRGRPLRRDWQTPGLFDPPETAPPDEGFWLEVKVAFQFREGGVRHAGYSGQWRCAIGADLRKMEADPHIRRAGLLLVVFNESAAILEKDLELLEALLMQQEVLAGGRRVRSVPILDRMGHRLCSLALWPTIQR